MIFTFQDVRLLSSLKNSEMKSELLFAPAVFLVYLGKRQEAGFWDIPARILLGRGWN